MSKLKGLRITNTPEIEAHSLNDFSLNGQRITSMPLTTNVGTEEFDEVNTAMEEDFHCCPLDQVLNNRDYYSTSAKQDRFQPNWRS